ncbi:uncharacterized protein METZ01_LOCUS66952 [marine metagenome]|uniref:Uncharacterized protein n=1 Tax=marine metagenome TaxID=408172 RepID=A0A381TEU5_9ZZZZ
MISKKTPEKASVFATGTEFSGSVDCSGCYLLGGKQALEKMVARIFPPGSEYDFQVEVIDSDWVNAVAFPGGKILISHGLLEKGHPVATVEAPVLTTY